MAKTSRELLEAFCEANGLALYAKIENPLVECLPVSVFIKEIGEDLAVEVKTEDEHFNSKNNKHGFFTQLGSTIEDACKNYIENALGCFLSLPHARRSLKFPKMIEELEILADLRSLEKSNEKRQR